MTQAVLKAQTTDLPSRSGLETSEREAVAKALSGALTDTYRLFIITQGLHWNVQGPLFYSIHKLTEEQYNDMFAAIDSIAERIRALGFPAPSSVLELTARSKVAEPERDADLKSQIQALIDGNETVAKHLRESVAQAESNNDVKTADLLTGRIGVHEENAWMLRATIAS